jgi:hypothetical protein
MALQVFQFCAEADPHARRYLTILESFNDTIQASQQARLSVSGSPNGPSIFNILFGSSSGQAGFDKASMEKSLSTGLAQPWEVDEAGLEGAVGSLLAADSQYEAPATDGRAAGSASWPLLPSGILDDSIDFSGVWWSGGQDNFVLDNDVQVPLYGLMEPI